METQIAQPQDSYLRDLKLTNKRYIMFYVSTTLSKGFNVNSAFRKLGQKELKFMRSSGYKQFF